MLGGYSVNTAGNRYQNIDESTASATDYIYSQNNPGGASSSEFLLSSITDPVSATGHVVRIGSFQIDEDSGSHPRPVDTSGTATTCAWELRQGATIIASGSISPTTAIITAYTLTATEANSITDYTDLRVYISPNGGGGSPTNRRSVAVYFIEFETPSPPVTNYQTTYSKGSLALSGKASTFYYPYDIDAQAFIDSIGTLTTPQKVAIDNLVKGLKFYNLWDLHAVFYPFIGGTASSHKWNLKDPRDLDAAHRLVYFTGGTGAITHDSNGIRFDSTDDTNGSWAFPHYYPSDYVADATYYDFNLSAYNNLDLSGLTRGRIMMAQWDGTGAGSPQLAINRISGETIYARSGTTVLQNNSASIPSTTLGFVTHTTAGTDNSNNKLYWDGVEVGSYNGGTRLSLTTPTNSDKGIAINTNHNGVSPPTLFTHGYAPDLSTCRYAFVAIGGNTILSPTNAADLYTVVEAYQVELGRANSTYTLTANKRSLSLAGKVSSFVRGDVIASAKRSLVLAGKVALFTLGLFSPQSKGAYALGGKNVDFARNYTLNSQKNSLSVSGKDATLSYVKVYDLALSKDSLSLSGKNTSLTKGKAVASSKGSLVLSGKNIDFLVAKNIATQKGALALSGKNIDFFYGSAKTLVSNKGSLVLGGKNINILRVVNIAGSINGTATVQGNLTDANAGVSPIAGVINGRTIIGTITSFDFSSTVGGFDSMVVSFDSVSTGEIYLTAKGALVGTSNASSTVIGALVAKGGLNGSAGGIASTSGLLTATGNLLGTINGVTSTSGILSSDAFLSGTIEGVASVIGLLTAKGSLLGTINNIATTEGDLINGTPTNAPIAGVINGVAIIGQIVSFDFSSTIEGFDSTVFSFDSTISTAIYLTAKGALLSTINGNSTVTGNLTAKGELAGVSDGIAIVTGIMLSTGEMSVSVNASSTVLGELTAKGSLLGTVNGSATVQGVLGSDAMSGVSNGSSTTSGLLTGQGALLGISNGVATTQGALLSDGGLAGVINGISTVTGELTAVGALEGIINGSSSTSADLTSLGTNVLAGTVNGSSTLIATLTGQGLLNGIINASSSTNATLIFINSGALSGVINASSVTIGTLRDGNELAPLNDWHTKFSGSRVPINDSGNLGMPFAFASNNLFWVKGSVNKTVVDTYLLNSTISDTDEAINASLGTFDFAGILKFVNKNMLYGYNADARDKTPGDMMSFRGYPTPVVASVSLESVDPYSLNDISYTGELGVAGTFIVLLYDVELTFKVPFDFIFDITLSNGPDIDFVTVKVDAGNNTITSYLTNPEEEDVSEQIWAPLASGIYFSIDSSSYLGDQTFSVTASNVIQEPYYGTLNVVNSLITEAEYAPASPPSVVKISTGFTYEGLDLATYLATVPVCNEFLSTELFPRLNYSRLYLGSGEILTEGSQLYSDPEGLTPAPEGIAMWVASAYVDTYETIWKITQYMIIDASGIVTYLRNPGLGYEGFGCAVS